MHASDLRRFQGGRDDAEGRSLRFPRLPPAPVCCHVFASRTGAGIVSGGGTEAAVTRPRCATCHVDGGNADPDAGGRNELGIDGMYIRSRDSCIGAGKIASSNSHTTFSQANGLAPSLPRAAIDSQSLLLTFIWCGRSGIEICAQQEDPKRKWKPRCRAASYASQARCSAAGMENLRG